MTNEANTVRFGETSTSPEKSLPSLQGAPLRAESNGERSRDYDRDLTMAEKDCVLTSSDDNVEYLSAFVTEKLQYLSKGSVEKIDWR